MVKLAMTKPLVLISTVFVTTVQGGILYPREAVPDGFVAASYYPAPYGGWVANWTDSYAKAAALVGNMTLAEKANITAGSGVYMGKNHLTKRCPQLVQAYH
jgi:beta-glucosidase